MGFDEIILYANDLFLTSLPQFPVSFQSTFTSKKSLMGYRMAQNRASCKQSVHIIFAYEMEKFSANPLLLSNSNLLLLTKSGLSIANLENSQSSNLVSFGENLSPVESASIPNFISSTATIAANININYAMDEKPAHSYRKKTEVGIILNQKIKKYLQKLADFANNFFNFKSNKFFFGFYF